MGSRNRVAPDGRIFADDAHGRWMGNRGCLHEGREVIRDFRGKGWIICSLEFRGRRVEQWAPGRYTVLFFHDEAVALAAGHRPCARCRRESYKVFVDAIGQAIGRPLESATELDQRLHRERVGARGEKRTHSLDWSDVPAGAFVLGADGPALALAEQLVPWSAMRYGPPTERPRRGLVEVMTPPTACAALAGGYEPQIESKGTGGRHRHPPVGREGTLMALTVRPTRTVAEPARDA